MPLYVVMNSTACLFSGMIRDVLYLCYNCLACATKLSTPVAPVMCAKKVNTALYSVITLEGLGNDILPHHLGQSLIYIQSQIVCSFISINCVHSTVHSLNGNWHSSWQCGQQKGGAWQSFLGNTWWASILISIRIVLHMQIQKNT